MGHCLRTGVRKAWRGGDIHLRFGRTRRPDGCDGNRHFSMRSIRWLHKPTAETAMSTTGLHRFVWESTERLAVRHSPKPAPTRARGRFQRASHLVLGLETRDAGGGDAEMALWSPPTGAIQRIGPDGRRRIPTRNAEAPSPRGGHGPSGRLASGVRGASGLPMRSKPSMPCVPSHGSCSATDTSPAP